MKKKQKLSSICNSLNSFLTNVKYFFCSNKKGTSNEKGGVVRTQRPPLATRLIYHQNGVEYMCVHKDNDLAMPPEPNNLKACFNCYTVRFIEGLLYECIKKLIHECLSVCLSYKREMKGNKNNKVKHILLNGVKKLRQCVCV